MTTTSRKPKSLACQLRNEVASIETYWVKPGAAVAHINAILARYELQIAETISWNDYLESARFTFRLESSVTGAAVEDCLVVFSWFRMPSGRYEITTYLS